jgi:hypothetical protein
VKSTATLSRPVNRVATVMASTPQLAPVPAPGTSAPAAAQPQLARKVAAPAKKPATKPQRNAPAPTPGMGMLLKLSTGGGGDISSLQGRSSDSSTGQSWVL